AAPPRRWAQIARCLAGEDPRELLTTYHAHLVGREAGLERAANRQDRGEERRAVWHVAREQDLPRGDEPEQGEMVGHAPPRGVEEEVRVVRSVAPDPGQVAHTVVGQDQPEARMT